MTNKCHKWQSVTKTNKSWQQNIIIFSNAPCHLHIMYRLKTFWSTCLIIFILIHHILLYIIWWYDSIQTDHQLLGGCRLPVLVYCVLLGPTNARFCWDPVPGSYLNVKDFSQVLATRHRGASSPYFLWLPWILIKIPFDPDFIVFCQFCRVVFIE